MPHDPQLYRFWERIDSKWGNKINSKNSKLTLSYGVRLDFRKTELTVLLKPLRLGLNTNIFVFSFSVVSYAINSEIKKKQYCRGLFIPIQNLLKSYVKVTDTSQSWYNFLWRTVWRYPQNCVKEVVHWSVFEIYDMKKIIRYVTKENW